MYRPVIRTALLVFRLLGFRFDLRGVENVPREGAAVLACNHLSYFDFMFVGLPAHVRGRRLVRFLAKQSVFRNRVTGPLMRGMRHIPVDRASGASAYQHAMAALAAGELVGIFPEQTISRAFVPRPLKTGAARLALQVGVPLIPMVTWGGHRVWTAGRRPVFRRRVPVTIVVDAPLTVTPGETAAELTDRLAERLRALVDEVLTDYPARERLGLWWWPAHLGGGAPTRDAATAMEQAGMAELNGR